MSHGHADRRRTHAPAHDPSPARPASVTGTPGPDGGAASVPRAGLGALVAPVYLPSFVYSAGTSVLVPVQVLLALRLGFSPGGVTMMATVVGAFAVASSVASGYLVHRLGEVRAVVLATAGGITGLVVAAATALGHAPGARWVLVVALMLFDLADAVWSVARQGMVADLVDPALRGRAMNLYGACQRLGRMVGPFLAAGVLACTDAAVALPLAGVVVGIATVMLVRGGRGHGDVHEAADVAARPAAASGTDEPILDDAATTAHERIGRMSRRRAVTMLGVGILVLSALRTAKETLVPLWASHGVHLSASHVALVVGLASAMELVLFWPAGLALDRLGRMPVVVTALALMGAGLVVLPLHRTPGWLIGACVLVGLGDGAGAGIIKTLGIDLAPRLNRARFLGWWSSIASVGSFAAPAAASALIVAASLPVALTCLGTVGLAGAAWMAWWTPRALPAPRRRAPAPSWDTGPHVNT